MRLPRRLPAPRNDRNGARFHTSRVGNAGDGWQLRWRVVNRAIRGSRCVPRRRCGLSYCRMLRRRSARAKVKIFDSGDEILLLRRVSEAGLRPIAVMEADRRRVERPQSQTLCGPPSITRSARWPAASGML